MLPSFYRFDACPCSSFGKILSPSLSSTNVLGNIHYETVSLWVIASGYVLIIIILLCCKFQWAISFRCICAGCQALVDNKVSCAMLCLQVLFVFTKWLLDYLCTFENFQADVLSLYSWKWNGIYFVEHYLLVWVHCCQMAWSYRVGVFWQASLVSSVANTAKPFKSNALLCTQVHFFQGTATVM